MRTDIIVEVRTSSSRLKEKALMNICGKPMIWHVLSRLMRSEQAARVIVATTTNERDDTLVDIANSLGVPSFRGSEEDVLERVVDTANYFGTEVIVEVTGDNPLSDPQIVDEAIKKYREIKDIDFLSTDIGWYNSKIDITFPIGLSAKVFSTALITAVAKRTTLPEDREHVVNYILRNMDDFRVVPHHAEGRLKRPELRLTVDYPEDFELVKHVYEHFFDHTPDFSALDVIEYLDANPAVRDLNKHCLQKKYTAS